MPPSQGRKCVRLLAGRVEGADEGGPARGVSAAGEGRDSQVGEASAMARARISERRGELARRPGRNVHGESIGPAPEPDAVSGLDERDRKSDERCAPAHAARLPVARREDGVALGRRRVADDRKEVSQNHGLQGSVDARSGVGKAQGRVYGKGGVK